MKREGRQHGMVRTVQILPSPLNPKHVSKTFSRFDSPTTAGSFTKVSNKPTSHSKFTGKHEPSKWSESHVQPTCKYKSGKSKGAEKTLRFSGASAGEILDDLFYNRMDCHLDPVDYDDEDSVGFVDYDDEDSFGLVANDDDQLAVLDDQLTVLDDQFEVIDDQLAVLDDWCLV